MIAQSKPEIVLRSAIIVFLCLLAFVALVPLLAVASTSFSSSQAVDAQKVVLWPVDFTLDSWMYMMARVDLWQSFLVTLAATLIGTVAALFLNAVVAYPLARGEFRPAKFILMAVVVAMVFKAPLIPYFLTVKMLALYDHPLVLVIPQLFAEFNLLIMVTFLRQFPAELEEAAIMEGCGYFRRLFHIVLPLSKAPLATLGMFYAVVIWNQFQHPLLFIQSPALFPLQIKIRQLITSENQLPMSGALDISYNMATLQAVAIVFAVIPILLVYPFLQKYFTKGALIGSIKG